MRYDKSPSIDFTKELRKSKYFDTNITLLKRTFIGARCIHILLMLKVIGIEQFTFG